MATTWNRMSRIVAVAALGMVAGCSSGDRTARDSADAPQTLSTDPTRACNELADRLRSFGAQVDVRNDSFPAFSGAAQRFGCVVRAEGVLGERVNLPFLTSEFADSLGGAWRRDSTIAADRPSAAAYAVRRDSVLCLVRVEWRMRVRYDPRADPPPYSASVGCETVRG